MNTPDKEPFIMQTAEDYDLPYDVVEKIYFNHPKEFYDKLEEELKIRRNN